MHRSCITAIVVFALAGSAHADPVEPYFDESEGFAVGNFFGTVTVNGQTFPFFGGDLDEGGIFSDEVFARSGGSIDDPIGFAGVFSVDVSARTRSDGVRVSVSASASGVGFETAQLSAVANFAAVLIVPEDSIYTVTGDRNFGLQALSPGAVFTDSFMSAGEYEITANGNAGVNDGQFSSSPNTESIMRLRTADCLGDIADSFGSTINSGGAPDGVVDFGDFLALLGLVGPCLREPANLFRPHRQFDSGYAPSSVAVGDLNGDGISDIAVANNYDRTVSVLLGNGNGTFQARRVFATGTNPSSTAIGDLDGDGNPDLAVSNYSYNTISVLLGNGDGTFQALRDFATGNRPLSVSIDDLDGDGILDLAVANSGSHTISVLLGNGDGTFQTRQNFATGSLPWSVAIGDLDGDGTPDLAVTNLNSGTVSMLLGKGDGTFQTRRDFATGSCPQSVTIGDLNDDGTPDIAVANACSDNISVLSGNGDGTFQARQNYATGNAPQSVAIGDLDGDGLPDLAVANNNSNTVSVLLGNGNGTFQIRRDFATGTGPQSVAIDDLNGDGLSDLVTANSNFDSSDSVSVLLGRPCLGDIADDFGTLGADGTVDFGDFLALLGLIGPCP